MTCDERRTVRVRDSSAHSVTATCATAYIRPLRRDDGELLDRVMAGMGEQSRYQRFHSPKPRLTASDRAYLTSADGRDHLALVALAGDGTPLGVAHAVRVRDDPAAAELAAAVVDAHQREGIGTELIRRLARRAAAAGLERLVAVVLAESGLAGRLERRGWRVIEREGHTLTLVVNAWLVAASPPMDSRPVPLVTTSSGRVC